MQKTYIIAIAVVIVFGAIAGGIMIYKYNSSKPMPTTPANSQIIEISPNADTPRANIKETKGVTSSTNISAGISLTINKPANNATVAKSSVTVSGNTQSKAEVSVNETELTADNKGNFSTIVTLDEGENTIVVVATDENGNFAEKEITVTYQTAD